MSLIVVVLAALSICSLALFILTYRVAQRHYANLNLSRDTLNQITDKQLALKNRISWLEHELKTAAEDSVTSLPSWTVFQANLKQAISESKRHQFNFALLFVDITGVDLINTALGEAASDNLLLMVAERLKSCIRQVDSVARFNQTTFALLLTQLVMPEKAAIVAERITKEFSEAFKFEDRELWLNACVGITVFPADGHEATTLLRNAQQALNRSKLHDHTMFQFYQEQMSHNSHRDLILVTDFNQESIIEQLQVNFDPVLDVVQQKVACMDARLQWLHPQYGIIRSNEFQMLIDQYRKRNELTIYLLRQACSQFKKWQSVGFTVGRLSISLEQSQLNDTHFICEFYNVLNELGFDTKLLRVKINFDPNESTGLIVEKSINRLQYLNISLALDCQASKALPLTMLKEFSFDALYLDEVLFDDIIDSPRTQLFMLALQEWTEKLSIDVVLSGITSGNCLPLLQKLGYEQMQGQQFEDSLSDMGCPVE